MSIIGDRIIDNGNDNGNTFRVSPLHKKWRKDNKENYRPVSILPALSKILERILFDQILVYFDKFLSDQQCEKDVARNIVF